MTLRMFALIMPKPVCVCVRSRAVNPAYIPGPDINAVFESRWARLAVMLEESSRCFTLSAFYERKGVYGKEQGHIFCRIYFSIQLRWISTSFQASTKRETFLYLCCYQIIIAFFFFFFPCFFAEFMSG